MKSATSFGACIALVASVCVNGVCFGQSAAESVVDCTRVADQSARLRCYDDHMRQLGHAITGDTAVVSKPAVSRSPVSQPAVAQSSPVSERAAAAAVSARAAVAPPSPARAAPAVTKQSEFGLSEDAVRRKRAAETGTAAPAEELAARIKTVSESAGELRIELDNDQWWVGTHRSGTIAPAAGDTVTIKHGALGSYFLTRESGPALRVKRIQ